MQCNTVYQLSKIGVSQDEPSCLCVEVMEVGVKWRRGKSVSVFNHGVNPSAADDDRTTRGTWHLVASAWVRVRSRALSPFPWACAPLLTKERDEGWWCLLNHGGGIAEYTRNQPTHWFEQYTITILSYTCPRHFRRLEIRDPYIAKPLTPNYRHPPSLFHPPTHKSQRCAHSCEATWT